MRIALGTAVRTRIRSAIETPALGTAVRTRIRIAIETPAAPIRSVRTAKFAFRMLTHDSFFRRTEI